MPFIVKTTRRPTHDADCFWNHATPSVDGDEAACCSCGGYDESRRVSRRAVATLEEARVLALQAFPRQPERGMRPPEWDGPFVALYALPESGPVAFTETEALHLLGAARAVIESAAMMGEAKRAAPLAQAMVRLAEATDKARNA